MKAALKLKILMMAWAIVLIFLMYSCRGTSAYLVEQKPMSEVYNLDLELKELNGEILIRHTAIDDKRGNRHRTLSGAKKYVGTPQNKM